MARIADERFSMHRSTQILRTVRGNNDQTHQDRYRATTRRMAAFRAGHRQPTPREPSRKQLCAVLPRSGPHNSTRPQLVSRVQRVSFHPDVTVYPADDYDRTDNWAFIAFERATFQHRIRETELILSPVLTKVHRMFSRINRQKLFDT